jgi:ribosome-associated protein
MKQQAIEFTISGEYIELIKLLKVTGLADTGGEAQAMVLNNQVKLNGVAETRKRAKIKPGDLVETSIGNILVS